MSCHHYRLRRMPERVPLTCTLAALAGLIAGCGTSSRTAITEPAAAHPQPSTASAHAAVGITPATPEPEIAEGAALTVDQVVRRAAARNPSREVFEATRAAAAAQIQLASAWANPELELSGGRAKARDSGERETIYGVDLRVDWEIRDKLLTAAFMIWFSAISGDRASKRHAPAKRSPSVKSPSTPSPWSLQCARHVPNSSCLRRRCLNPAARSATCSTRAACGSKEN